MKIKKHCSFMTQYVKINCKIIILLSFCHTVHANTLQSANDMIGDPLEDYFWYQDFAVSIGLGGGLMPEFEGSNAYKFNALPVIDLNYKRALFLSSQRGAGAQFPVTEHVSIGGRVLYNFGRDNEGYLNNMNDLSGSVDGGIFIRLMFAPWIVNFDAQTALTTTGHKGTYGGTSLAYEYQYSKNWQFLTRAGVSFANDSYMRAYFGVTPEEAENTGFKQYKPSAGFKDADIAFSPTYAGFENWRIFSTVAVGVLGDIPAGSDVVQTRIQYKILVASTYSF